jgi:hypothetical protein
VVDLLHGLSSTTRGGGRSFGAGVLSDVVRRGAQPSLRDVD